MPPFSAVSALFLQPELNALLGCMAMQRPWPVSFRDPPLFADKALHDGSLALVGSYMHIGHVRGSMHGAPVSLADAISVCGVYVGKLRAGPASFPASYCSVRATHPAPRLHHSQTRTFKEPEPSRSQNGVLC
jgi:hypothetical protein